MAYTLRIGPICLQVRQEGHGRPARFERWVEDCSPDLVLTALPHPEPLSHRGPSLRTTRTSLTYSTYSCSITVGNDPSLMEGHYYDDEMWERRLMQLMRLAYVWHLTETGRGVLFHGAAIFSPYGGILLVGPSGAGKSTAASLCPWPVGNDETGLVTLDGPPELHSTPFGGEVVPEPMSAPLAAVLRVEHGRGDVGIRPLRDPSMPEVGARWQLLLSSSIIPQGRMEKVAGPLLGMARKTRMASLVTDLEGTYWKEVEAWLTDGTV